MFSKFFTFSLSAFIALVFTAMSFGQAVIFEDNFDSYTAGMQLVVQNPIDWVLWSGGSGTGEDPFVSDAHSLSPSNSVVIVPNNDLVKPYGDLTSGKYSIAFMVYIPTGKEGQFVTLSGFTSGWGEFAMAVLFRPGGSGSVDGGAQGAATFTYAYDTWQSVKVIVDLDNDIGEFWFDGAMVHTWQWTLGSWGTGSALQLAASDIFGLNVNDEMYIDDFVFTDLLAPFTDDFDSYTVGGQLACQNPIDWTTWSNLPCDPVEDAYISDNYAYNGTNSAVFVLNNDVVKPLGTQTSGKWDIGFMIYIPAGKTGYFNCESELATWWAMECYFEVGGSGMFFGGSATGIPFNWIENTWQLCRVVVDLDFDLAEFWLDGVLINSWQWTLGSAGQGGLLQLDVVNFYGAIANDEMYVDDFMFGQYPTVPVELTSFAAKVNNEGSVVLNWSTATEINNQMFEIERRSEEGQYLMIGYVNGHGTTTEAQEYSYIDNTVETGTYFYRLKQIDFLGTYEYSDEIEVEVNGPLTFGLEQNYPNPFNPSTNIKYNIPESGIVKLVIYSMLGEEVAVLVDGMVEAGFYEVTFDASNLPSGAYFYRLQSDNLNQVKKMLLMK